MFSVLNLVLFCCRCVSQNSYFIFEMLKVTWFPVYYLLDLYFDLIICPLECGKLVCILWSVWICSPLDFGRPLILLLIWVWTLTLLRIMQLKMPQFNNFLLLKWILILVSLAQIVPYYIMAKLMNFALGKMEQVTLLSLKLSVRSLLTSWAMPVGFVGNILSGSICLFPFHYEIWPM